MTNTYDIGDLVRLDATFTGLDGVPSTPTTTVCTVRRPDGTEETPVPQTASPGALYALVAATMPGRWHYRWVGTGVVQAAEEGVFVVRQSAVGA